MGNERDYDGEYEKDRHKQPENEVSWDSLAKEDKVYEFTKLTPTPPDHYQKKQVTKNSLDIMEGYGKSAYVPQFYSPEKPTESPKQDNQQGKQGERQKPQQPKKPGWLQRMFGGRSNQQPNQKQPENNELENVTERTPRARNQRNSKDTLAVANFKQRLRKQGKANLNQNQQNVAVISETYTNPKKTAESKPLLDDLRVQTRKAGEIKAERKRLERELVLFGGTELTAGEAGMGGAIRHDPQRKAELQAQLEQVKQVEAAFLAEYPLASLLNTKQVDDSVSNKQLQQHLSGRLGKITESIEQTKQGLDNGDIPIEELDGLIPSVLANTPKNERAEVEKYIEGKLRRDARIKTATTVGSLGLTVGALAAAPVTAGTSLSGVPLALSGLGAVLGFTGSAYNFERAGDLNRVAKTADAGGDRLLNDPKQAKQDYIFAQVDLALGLIDGGLAITEGTQVYKGLKAADKLATRSGARVVNRLPEDKLIAIQRAVDLEQAGDPAASKTLAVLKQELGEDYDDAYDLFKNSNLRVLDDAEAKLVTGGFTKSEYDGRTYDSLSPKEKEAFKKIYHFRENSEAREAVGKPEVIVRNPGQVKEGHPPLHLEYDDNGNQIIKTGTDKSSERLSNPSRMKTNLETKLGRKVKEDHQIHHVIPDNRVRGNPLAREAYDRDLYDLDRASNLKELPKRGKPGEIVHRGSHRKWDRHVDEVLETKQQELLEAYGVDSVKKLPNTPEANEAIKRVMKSAEQDLQEDLVDTELGLKEGWLRREPDGLKLSENDRDFNVVETA